MVIDVVQNADLEHGATTITLDEDRYNKYYTNTCATNKVMVHVQPCKKYLVKVTSGVATASLSDKDVNSTTTYTVVSDNNGLLAAHTATGIDTDYGYKASHISASFGLGAVTARLGYTSKDSNDPMDKMKEKTTFFGMNGSIGDTGMDWRAWGRNVEGHDGKESSPWGAGVGKALGGGAYAWIEHRNKDKGESGNTFIALNVDF